MRKAELHWHKNKTLWSSFSHRLPLPRGSALTACLPPASWRKGPNYPWSSGMQTVFLLLAQDQTKCERKKEMTIMLFCVEHNQKITSFLHDTDISCLPLIRSWRCHAMLTLVKKILLACHVCSLDWSLLKGTCSIAK